jgi:hypothetical protein
MDRWRGEDIAFGAAERRSDGALVGMFGLARVLFPGPVEGAVEIGWRLVRGALGARLCDRGGASLAGARLRRDAASRGGRLRGAGEPGVACGDGTVGDDARPRARLPASEPAGGSSAARAHGLGDRAGGVATGRVVCARRRAGMAMTRDPIDRSGLRPEFWRRYPLESLPRDEWEALCDGCAKCCLIKLEDEETDRVALHQHRLPAARPRHLPLRQLCAAPAAGRRAAW